MTEEIRSTAAKGVTGVITPVCGLIVSHVDRVEAVLRIASLAIGVAVGIATFISIVRKKK